MPSHKFLPLMYQLAARLRETPGQGEEAFQSILEQLIQRTCYDHPHHTLFIILALANANKDDEITK